MKPVNIVLAPVFCSLFFLALTGCSKSDAPKTAPSPSTSKRPPLPEEKPPFTREKLKEISAYRTVDVSPRTIPVNQEKAFAKTMLTLYWSASKESADLAAGDLFDDVFAESDIFRRQDLAKKYTAEAEAFISESRKFSPVAFPLPAKSSKVRVLQYDPQEKRFALNIFEDIVDFYMPRAKGGRTLSATFTQINTTLEQIYYKPKDETEARRIEASLAASRDGGSTDVPVIAYGRVVATKREESTRGGGNDRIQHLTFYIVVDGLAIQAPKTGETMFTLGADELGKKIFFDLSPGKKYSSIK